MASLCALLTGNKAKNIEVVSYSFILALPSIIACVGNKRGINTLRVKFLSVERWPLQPVGAE